LANLVYTIVKQALSDRERRLRTEAMPEEMQ